MSDSGHFSPALLHLAIAVLAQAVRDSKSRDNTRALIAQTWLVDTGAIWFDALGLNGEEICQAILRLPAGRFYFPLGLGGEIDQQPDSMPEV